MIWFQDSWGNPPFDQVPIGVNHLFGLLLNPMTDRTEATRLVAIAEYRSEIESLLRDERVEPYKDDNWHKVYRKGGPLEWYNAPDGIFTELGIVELRRDGWRRVA